MGSLSDRTDDVSEAEAQSLMAAYWRELTGYDATEQAMAESVAALRDLARSGAPSKAALLRVVRQNAAEHVAALLPPGSGNRFSAESRGMCTTIPLRIAARAGGELGADERAELAEHLDTCLTCSAIQLKMARADRAFATRISGPNARDEKVEAPALTPGHEAIEAPARPPGEERHAWIRRVIVADHDAAFASVPNSGQRSAGADCTRARGRLAAHARDDLASDERHELRMHLDGCMPCQAAELKIVRIGRASTALTTAGIAIDVGAEMPDPIANTLKRITGTPQADEPGVPFSVKPSPPTATRGLEAQGDLRPASPSFRRVEIVAPAAILTIAAAIAAVRLVRRGSRGTSPKAR